MKLRHPLPQLSGCRPPSLPCSLVLSAPLATGRAAEHPHFSGLYYPFCYLEIKKKEKKKKLDHVRRHPYGAW